MARDPIANYVVSKAIEVSEGEQKKRLVALLASDRAVLVSAAYHFCSFANILVLLTQYLVCHTTQAKSPYAKYVLQNIDKLEQ